MSEQHIIASINFHWEACGDCAKSPDNGGFCNGDDASTHEYAEQLACDDFAATTPAPTPTTREESTP